MRIAPSFGIDLAQRLGLNRDRRTSTRMIAGTLTSQPDLEELRDLRIPTNDAFSQVWVDSIFVMLVGLVFVFVFFGLYRPHKYPANRQGTSASHLILTCRTTFEHCTRIHKPRNHVYAYKNAQESVEDWPKGMYRHSKKKPTHKASEYRLLAPAMGSSLHSY